MSKIAMNRQCRVKVKFGDAVENVNQVERDPAAKGIDRIVGLEHIDPENLHIRRWNTLENGTSFTRKFVPGQTLFGKRRAYQRKVGYAEFEGICSGDILTFESKDEKVLLPELLPFICQTDAFFDYAIGTSAGSLSPRTSWKALKDFEFPLPPIEDQKRITEILWAADESLEAWIATSEALETAKQQFLGLIFQKARKVTDGWKLKKLREVADLQTGLAIGRKYSNKENTVELPYLRVANVKDGYLDLREIKTIRVLLSEVERYSVRYGDVLLTEGGDFDKVGRGTVWNGKLEECLHQNHVFCVRPKKGVLLPEFLSYQTASPYGKRYFLKCAKKTSNLASINSTQVKNFPVLLAPIEEQGRSIGLLKLIEAKQAQVQEHTNYLRSLIKRCLNTIKAGEPANV